MRNHKLPVPKNIQSNVKLLEEHIAKINWAVFSRAYMQVLGYALLTIFTVMLTVGVANMVLKALSLWLF